jgi:hypothetical protein
VTVTVTAAGQDDWYLMFCIYLFHVSFWRVLFGWGRVGRGEEKGLCLVYGYLGGLDVFCWLRPMGAKGRDDGVGFERGGGKKVLGGLFSKYLREDEEVRG